MELSNLSLFTCIFLVHVYSQAFKQVCIKKYKSLKSDKWDIPY